MSAPLSAKTRWVGLSKAFQVVLEAKELIPDQIPDSPDHKDRFL
jgi:hypothetical protein